MYDNQQRIDEFKTELAALRTKSTASVTGDRRFLVLGIALMAVGLIAIMLGWWGASGTTETPEAIFNMPLSTAEAKSIKGSLQNRRSIIPGTLTSQSVSSV